MANEMNLCSAHTLIDGLIDNVYSFRFSALHKIYAHFQLFNI